MAEFREHQLENGLKIVGECDKSAVSCACGFFVQTGARDENKEISGVSHFLEHMVFKGGKKRNALQITYDLAALGAQSNAYTGLENTVYYASVLPEYFEGVFDILSDMMRPTLEEAEFLTEKGVILEEIALYEDRPTHVLFEAALSLHFLEHPAANSVLGSKESIRKLSVSQMREYFESRYSADNIVLAGSGNFSWEKLIDMAQAACGEWKAFEPKREVVKHNFSGTRETIKRPGLSKVYSICLIPGPGMQDEARYAGAILSSILGDASSSLLYWRLIDTGLADVVSADLEEMFDVGIFTVFTTCSSENVEKMESEVESVLNKPLEFTEEDLQRAKRKLSTRMVLQEESVLRRLIGLGSEWLARKRYFPLEKELEKINAVSREDIEKYVAQFPFKEKTVVHLVSDES